LIVRLHLVHLVVRIPFIMCPVDSEIAQPAAAALMQTTLAGELAATGECDGLVKVDPAGSVSTESTRATYDIDALAETFLISTGDRKAIEAQALLDKRAKFDALEKAVLAETADNTPQGQFDCTCPATDDDLDFVVEENCTFPHNR